jgi:hypothetical protein
MRAGALSAAWDLAGIHHREAAYEQEIRDVKAPASPVSWSSARFADEQIRGLVRQVFSAALHPPVQQLILTATEQETDVRILCHWMGEVLTQEKSCEVAVSDESERGPLQDNADRYEPRLDQRRVVAPIRQFASRINKNVWSISHGSSNHGAAHGASLCAYLSDLRREFEYSIVAAPCATSSQALEMARFADGIILVVSAKRTRRTTALKIRNAMAQVRLLGTILSDREFPMPQSIYQRL